MNPPLRLVIDPGHGGREAGVVHAATGLRAALPGPLLPGTPPRLTDDMRLG